MGILDKLTETKEKYEIATAVVQLQKETISELTEKIKHLEELLKYEPVLINPKDK